MSTVAPGPATTTTGADLPLVALPQTALLTVNEAEVPLIRDAVGEGINFKPLRLDLERNEWVVPSLPMSGETLTIKESLTLEGENWSMLGCRRTTDTMRLPPRLGSPSLA